MTVDDAIKMSAACTFNDYELSRRILRCIVKREYINGVRPDYVEFDTEDADYKAAKSYYEANIKEEQLLAETSNLNSKGIALEKEGKIDEAIAVYEQCATLGYRASHCYERLRILYKKRKDYDNMARIMRRCGEVYGELPAATEEMIQRNLPKNKRVQ